MAKSTAGVQDRIVQVKAAAEADLVKFIELVAPYRVLGSVHKEVCGWLDREEASTSQLVLLPRDHQKSAIIAYWCAREVARNPIVRILYISATSNLAEKQLKMIKDILTSDIFQYYWPGYVHQEEGKRAKWTSTEIEIDHPLRMEEGVRDPTIFTGGLTTSLTGLHADVVIGDDMVVFENAYTREGRNRVKSQYSLLHSIAGTGEDEYETAREISVGTRYDPRDLYGEMIEMQYDVYDKIGNVIDRKPVYEVFERKVESLGDGTGEFLWPRQQRYDGRWFGFNKEILAQKRAKYIDRRQFRAQYYNDPNDATDAPIPRDRFQYFDRKFLARNAGRWFYKDRQLNIFASIDFAFSLKSTADYTALVVIGVDWEKNIYVLDIQRIKTDRIAEYFKLILAMHVKWDFRKLRAEINVAQATVVKELKNEYLKPNGLALSIDEHRPTRHQGSKEERMAAILEPRYDNLAMWHYQGGECQTLEDELTMSRPPHDDVKDALASAIEIAIPPIHSHRMSQSQSNIVYHERFGGVQYRA